MNFKQMIFRVLFTECTTHQFIDEELVWDEEKTHALITKRCRLCGHKEQKLIVSPTNMGRLSVRFLDVLFQLQDIVKEQHKKSKEEIVVEIEKILQKEQRIQGLDFELLRKIVQQTN